jgi:hypothetical protein
VSQEDVPPEIREFVKRVAEKARRIASREKAGKKVTLPCPFDTLDE